MNHMTSNYFGLGNSCLVDGRFDEAITFYKLAINEEPRFYLYYESLGKALLRLNDRGAEAEKAFNKAIELNNSAVCSIYYLGRAYAQKSDYANSICWLHRAADIDRNPIILELLGLAYYESGHADKAFATFREMKKCSFLSVECCVKRLQKKINIGFDSLLSYLTKDECNGAGNAYEEPERALYEVSTRDSGYVNDAVERGELFIEKKQWDRAKIEFYSAIRALLTPSDGD